MDDRPPRKGQPGYLAGEVVAGSLVIFFVVTVLIALLAR